MLVHRNCLSGKCLVANATISNGVGTAVRQVQATLSGGNTKPFVTATNKLEGITIFPNPAKDKVAIYMNEDNVAGKIVNISDMYGRALKQYALPSGQKLIRINTTIFASGMYIITVQDRANRKTTTQKMIIQ